MHLCNGTFGSVYSTQVSSCRTSHEYLHELQMMPFHLQRFCDGGTALSAVKRKYLYRGQDQVEPIAGMKPCDNKDCMALNYSKLESNEYPNMINNRRWDSVSAQGQDLVFKLMERDPLKRLSAEQVCPSAACRHLISLHPSSSFLLYRLLHYGGGHPAVRHLSAAVVCRHYSIPSSEKRQRQVASR